MEIKTRTTKDIRRAWRKLPYEIPESILKKERARFDKVRWFLVDDLIKLIDGAHPEDMLGALHLMRRLRRELS